MDKLDNRSERDVSGEDHKLLLSQVICGDAELYYLDRFLHEVFGTVTF